MRMDLLLNRIVRFSILVAAFLAPLLYLPVTPDPLFIKVVLIQALAVVALAVWLLLVLVEKRIRFTASPLGWVFVALALVVIAATIGSEHPWGSFWGPDATGEKAASVLSFLILSFIAASTFERRDAARLAGALVASSGLLGLFVIGQIVAARIGPLPAWLSSNPVGTTNALSMVLAIGFVFGAVVVLAMLGRPQGSATASRPLAWFAALAAILTLPGLILIRYPAVWVALGAVFLVLLAYAFAKSRGAGRMFGGAAVGIGFLILVLAVFLVFRPLPGASRVYQPPAEVSPSLPSTLVIAGRVLQSDPALGLGPAKFDLAWMHLRDPAVNQSVFWPVRFAHGYAYLATLPATTGSLGTLAVLTFVIVGALTLGRWLAKSREPDPLAVALGAGVLGAFLLWVLAPGNFTLSLLLFLMLGAAVGLAAAERREENGIPFGRQEGSPDEGRGAVRRIFGLGLGWLGLWRWPAARRREIAIEAPALNFPVSLAAVFAAAMSLFALYWIGAHYTAEVYFRRAADVLARFGNLDSARVFAERAIGLHGVSDAYHRFRAQVALLRIQQLILQAAAEPGVDRSSEFRQEFSAGVQAAGRAQTLSPHDSQNWVVLGQLYEAVVPFVAGADRASRDAYGRARTEDPIDPSIPLAQARVELSLADILQLRVAQAPAGQPQKDLFQARSDALDRAREALERSLGLKPDYASAHFLAAQLAIRENDLASAVASTEATARLAPADIGVLFQLGVLYYRAGQLDDAKQVLEAALLVNENYSNARYFLGLIWDWRGDQDAALSQFQKIRALNPGNEEVRRIIANLAAGRPALAEIVPPAIAPEERREAPVPESRQ